MDERTSSVMDTTPERVRRNVVAGRALQLHRVFEHQHAVARGSYLGQQRSPRSSCRCWWPRDQTFGARARRARPPGRRSSFRPRRTAPAITPMVRLRSAKAGPGAAGGRMPRSVHGFGQFGGQQRLAAMHLRADVGRDQADDSLAIGFGQLHAHRRAARRQAIHPKGAVRVEHDFHHVGSSSAVAISGPIAVRSIWMRRSSDVALMDWETALMTHAPAHRGCRRVLHPHRIGMQFSTTSRTRLRPRIRWRPLLGELLETRLAQARAALCASGTGVLTVR